MLSGNCQAVQYLYRNGYRQGRHPLLQIWTCLTITRQNSMSKFDSHHDRTIGNSYQIWCTEPSQKITNKWAKKKVLKWQLNSRPLPCVVYVPWGLFLCAEKKDTENKQQIYKNWVAFYTAVLNMSKTAFYHMHIIPLIPKLSGRKSIVASSGGGFQSVIINTHRPFLWLQGTLRWVLHRLGSKPTRK